MERRSQGGPVPPLAGSDATKKSRVAFCSISQSVDFMMLSKHSPTLVTNSVIYMLSDNPAEQRPAVATEYFAMQAMPVLLPSDHKAARHFAFAHLLESDALTLHHCRMLAGNGMNVAAVGTALGFALATVEFIDASESPGHNEPRQLPPAPAHANQLGSLRALVAAWQFVCLSSVAGRRPLSQMLGQCELSGVIAHGAP